MSTLGELINKLALSGGMDADDDGLKTILGNTAVSSLELTDDVVNAINSNLLTIDSAKNNADLKNHFTALALAGVDGELARLQTSYDLTPEIIEKLKGETSSYKRIGMLVEQVKALESAKIGQTKEGQDVLQKSIDDLNKQILENNTSHQTALTDQSTKHRGEMQNLLVKTALSNYDYSLPTSKEVAVSTAENIIFGELAKQGGTVILDDNNNLVLKQSANPEMDLFQDHQKVDFKGFAESTLASHKLLKTIDTPPTGTPPSIAPGTPSVSSNSFAQSVDNNITDLENAS